MDQNERVSKRQPPVSRAVLLNMIRRTLADMPEYSGDAEHVSESTPAPWLEVDYVERIAIRDKWPLRLGYLIYEPEDLWRDIIDQCDLSDD